MIMLENQYVTTRGHKKPKVFLIKYKCEERIGITINSIWFPRKWEGKRVKIKIEEVE